MMLQKRTLLSGGGIAHFEVKDHNAPFLGKGNCCLFEYKFYDRIKGKDVK